MQLCNVEQYSYYSSALSWYSLLCDNADSDSYTKFLIAPSVICLMQSLFPCRSLLLFKIYQSLLVVRGLYNIFEINKIKIIQAKLTD